MRQPRRDAFAEEIALTGWFAFLTPLFLVVAGLFVVYALVAARLERLWLTGPIVFVVVGAVVEAVAESSAPETCGTASSAPATCGTASSAPAKSGYTFSLAPGAGSIAWDAD